MTKQAKPVVSVEEKLNLSMEIVSVITGSTAVIKHADFNLVVYYC